jgi:nucleoside-triphosphatase THEP1
LRFKTTDQIVVAGRKGTGKSTYVKALIRPIDRFILFDYHWEHTLLGYPIHDISKLPYLWSKGVRRVVYLPHYRSFEELEQVCEVAKQIRNLVLIIDECDRIVEKKANLNKKQIGDLIHSGRHYGVGLITVTRRFADLHEAFLSQADWIVFFSMHSSKDMDRLEKEAGPEALKISELPQYFFGEYDGKANHVTWYRKLDLEQVML